MEDEIVDDNVTKMLQAGMFEEGIGAWGFPVVLVKKKDGTVRFCVDYRALNKITKKDVHPLPRIDETLEALGGASLFTTLDLLANSRSTGEQVQDCIHNEEGFVQILYLGDIIVFTRGGITRQLATVLERLATAGLTLKLKTCLFATTAMEYLGHELSSDGVRPLPRLVSAVQDFPRPKDAVEAKPFVHLAGYYRRFVEGFGSIMAPITKLLRKNVDWEWTPAQESAFDCVKAELTKQPLLIYPDFQLPFRVVTDASQVGLGACLMQDKGDGWRPVTYDSKMNSVTESKYGITELEGYAVVWAIKIFRPYLYGHNFTIVTDHSALKWSMISPNLTDKLHRWALTLQEFNFDVEYRPGTTNVVADALSRAPTVATTRTAVGRRTRPRQRAAGRADTAGTTAVNGAETATEWVVPATRDGAGATTFAGRTCVEDVLGDVLADLVASVVANVRSERRKATNNEERRMVGVSGNQATTKTEDGTGKGPGQTEAATAPSSTTERRMRRKQRMVSATEATRPFTRAVKRRMNEERLREAESVMATHLPGDEVSSAKSTELGQAEGATTKSNMTDSTATLRRPPTTQRRRTPVTATMYSPSEARVKAADRRGTKKNGAVGGTMNTETKDRLIRSGPRAAGNECGSICRMTGEYDQDLDGQSDVGNGRRSERVGQRCSLRTTRPLTPRRTISCGGTARDTPTSVVGNRVQGEPRLGMGRAPANCSYVCTNFANLLVAEPRTRSEALDRWALSVAGPLPTTDSGQRFIIAAVEYVTRYAVAVTVQQHTAENVASFLMQNVVNLEGLRCGIRGRHGAGVWDVWVDFAVYAYNSGRHLTVVLSPNDLMMGRQLRSPNDLLRRVGVAETGELTSYHRRLLAAMREPVTHAPNEHENENNDDRLSITIAKYGGSGGGGGIEPNGRVWMYRPPRGPKASKFVHQWVGPMSVIEQAGYDNHLLEREDDEGSPVAADIKMQLEYESALEHANDDTAAGEIMGATKVPVHATVASRSQKRNAQTVASADSGGGQNEILVEFRRRRRRNEAGHYVLEYQLRPARDGGSPRDGSTGKTGDEGHWVSVREYDRLFHSDRVAEDPVCGENV
ncbi:hypothetical protein PPTG_21901 [Phytophthora nicotianae INRA-310]|uniref:Reverse transcriptase RNase H-like domain-containing protein n=1 Tax=Phytophthora nicotianae (strain INRA-310) TaxID=761204 RepID=W2QTS2_PHYN3|nr:hypothetical protein PPTG_21901 [Phytophthora nicotianae INRA-310]ETN16341.1 hypothetical protein PPTG_21901 [Phytophthora nicotianae INRA-310]